ncbi:O-methyltransferase [Hanstruepera ponticola]|uniref:O-methyltransferase n=1 Tax=Hanstruepera ponticola TaxID=2042995 RepID=UPI00177B0461|nr:class I SAM-dependent methyltransferase [Hanstruepera ponticola]
MWYSILSYLKFIISSTNQHGVHSPYIYDLVTKCFYDQTVYTAYSKLSHYRTHLLRNDSLIKITDLGPGSKKHKSETRQISDIAKTSGTTLKRSKLLFRLTQYLNPQNMLELGTSLGIATNALALGNPKSKIISIEGCPNIATFTKQQLKNHTNTTILTGDFNAYLQKLKSQSFDLIFFDGNHTKEATINYFNQLLPTTNNDSVFVFDDIYWSKGMTEAWEQIKKYPQVTVTIDTYFWGFVFFRKEQVKEHFKIRL